MRPTRPHASASLAALAPAALALAACSGASGAQQPIEPAPEPRTQAVLAGPLCQDDRCSCRQGDDDAGRPEQPGVKRFEIRLGPSDDPLWATVDGMVLFKSRERPDACFYVDLQPGDHAITFRGQGDGGLSAALAISEQGGAEGATWWYRTFDFTCGAPGVCAVEDLTAWKQEVASYQGKHDPCGSTKIKGIEWETGRMPDRSHPDDLLMRLTLDVYKFIPQHRPGASECDRGGGDQGGAPAGDEEPSMAPVPEGGEPAPETGSEPGPTDAP
ncbi:MAG TPA: hypothetical protein VKZ63_12260 [Kofleriaceae bacterium]|nr:hypothetical protein [Kofleriaceae bacterium]